MSNLLIYLIIKYNSWDKNNFCQKSIFLQALASFNISVWALPNLGATAMPDQRRQWHPTPVLSPGKSYGWRSLVAAAHGVTKNRTWLSDFPFTFHFHALEKEMATHSIVLAWRIPGTGEPGGLPSRGSHRVRHDWSDLAAAAAAAMPDNRIFWVCSNISVIVYRHMPMQLLIRIAGWVMVWEIRGFIPLRGPVPDSSIGTIE